MQGDRPEATVVGAGIAGVMTALSLLRRGCRVTLVDRWEPGHARASSSDYTRILRAVHGSDELYTRWVREARLRWLELQAEIGSTLYVECGALVLAGEGQSGWEDSTFPTFERLGVPHFRLDADEIRLRFPQFSCANVAYGIHEPESGLVMARRAVVQTARLFVREGGALRRGRVDVDEAERPCLDGRPIASDLVVMTAGPWLGNLFRRTVRPISKVVRQDIVYTSTPEGDTAYDAERMPCWVDHGYGAYGTPSVEGCGVKAAIAWEATVIDLDEDARVVETSVFHRTQQYLRHRFPGLAGQRPVDQKACQIAMTPDTHFIIDFHPEHRNVLIAGGCSGHLFKHGPVFGDFVAGVGLREWGTAPRFRLGTRQGLSLAESPPAAKPPDRLRPAATIQREPGLGAPSPRVQVSSFRTVVAMRGERMNSYFVMAKMDDGDAPFDGGLIDEKYPENYPLVPGHVWLVVTRNESSFDVAKCLGLVSGGKEDASGMVVPAKGYWGFAHRDLWRMLQPEGSPDAADPAAIRRLGADWTENDRREDRDPRPA